MYSFNLESKLTLIIRATCTLQPHTVVSHGKCVWVYIDTQAQIVICVGTYMEWTPLKCGT